MDIGKDDSDLIKELELKYYMEKCKLKAYSRQSFFFHKNIFQNILKNRKYSLLVKKQISQLLLLLVLQVKCLENRKIYAIKIGRKKSSL